MMLIGVISDTHGRLDRSAYNALADCDHIIHAGDIGNPAILRELETIAPVTAVLGNNDFNEYGSAVSRYAHPLIDGVRFLVAHYPEDVRITSFGCRALEAGDPLPHICIHGHTHVPRLDHGKDAKPAQYVLCPGSASYPRQGSHRSIARIGVADGSVCWLRITTFNGRTVMQAGDLPAWEGLS